MRLKLFRAATTAEAMARVRAELGADALILGTRRVADGVELTAALEPSETQHAAPPLPDPARVAALRFHGVPDALQDALCGGTLDAALARVLSFGSLPLAVDSAPLLLVGPPGAGKTLTAVRLATRLVMAGTKPLVVTADGRRAGATEQMAAFTRLLGISLVVASHPVTLARALARRQDGAPVLIDTQGADPFDPAQADALRALASATGATVALVLPAGLDPAESADLAGAFAAAGATLLVATRLDLSCRFGGLLAAAASARLAITEAGTGFDAADGLAPLTPAALAACLMQTKRPLHERHAA